MILHQIDNRIARARVKKWIPPDKPCSMCGELLDRVIAHNPGEEWSFAWECPNYCGWEEEFIMEWPFIRGYVWSKDISFLGIEVI